ncbi:baseplate J/gp47 family protein [Paenibacillus sp. 19GGS1-52]|uniref:baseplate J/gp47 family protein n=1 Tax=Paenibacillus sp. 19GGS1-52 TaxID=2758563 RepID=UPI001EFACB0A|nr:baseplate J/gp47 family protein [Paenibacillus sp. 19GGS1-52]ULO09677.1 baseplate J/gp47 family protein [Paenibacillus sp. 19GGS1-52]
MDELVKAIKQQLLNQISNDYDKSDGYLLADIMSSVAYVFNNLSIRLDDIEKLLDVDNLTGDLLTKFVEQRRGIVRNDATLSIGQVTATGSGTVNIGDLFETANGIQFAASETKVISGTGTVNIVAIIAGNNGNVPANQIVQIPVTLTGITSVTNPASTYNGFDIEIDSALRNRYYLAVRSPATSGNVAHYMAWAMETDGVGDAKVFPSDGDIVGGISEVDVVIINANKQPASAALVTEVQTYIDPSSTGLGYGQAPIGAKCYVSSATGLTLNISLSLTYSSGYTLTQVKQNISNSVTAYLQSIAFKQLYVSAAKVGDAILNSAGVLDYTTLLLNGSAGNVTTTARQIAVMGVVTVV